MQFDKDGKLIPFEKDAVHTLSYDEKPGIQAIATTGEDRPPIPNTDKRNGYQRDYEYVRLGPSPCLQRLICSQEKQFH